MSTTQYAHIVFNAEGVPMLEGTQVKVIEVALDHVAYGWNAEQIHRQCPTLTLGQIHSALAYYHDHRREMDEAIEEDYREVKQIRAELAR